MASVADALAMAARSHAAGKLSLAEQFSWAVLGEEPNNAEALHLLGLIARQKGNAAQAIDYFNRSIINDGSRAVTWKDLGDAHIAVGDLRAGVANYEQALRLQPDCSEACLNLGLVYTSPHLLHWTIQNPRFPYLFV